MTVLSNDLNQGAAPEALQHMTTGYVDLDRLLGGGLPREGTVLLVGNDDYRTSDFLSQLCFCVAEENELAVRYAASTSLEPGPGFGFIPLEGCPDIRAGCAQALLTALDTEVPKHQIGLVGLYNSLTAADNEGGFSNNVVALIDRIDELAHRHHFLIIHSLRATTKSHDKLMLEAGDVMHCRRLRGHADVVIGLSTGDSGRLLRLNIAENKGGSTGHMDIRFASKGQREEFVFYTPPSALPGVLDHDRGMGEME